MSFGGGRALLYLALHLRVPAPCRRPPPLVHRALPLSYSYSTAMAGPLHGVRVLEIAGLAPAPFAGAQPHATHARCGRHALTPTAGRACVAVRGTW
jgi:hypothetical protein